MTVTMKLRDTDRVQPKGAGQGILVSFQSIRVLYPLYLQINILANPSRFFNAQFIDGFEIHKLL